MRSLVLFAASAALCAGTAAAYAAVPKAKALGDPVGSVQGLISRRLGPQYVSSFILQVIPADPATGNDVFELDSSGSSPVIRGNTGVALASGLGWYLKYYCNSSWGWGRNGTGYLVQLPAKLALPTPQRIVSPARYRYSWNVCTFGYSYVWYSFDQWQDELDRMALWGVNLPLAFVGQEYIWRQFYYSLNLTDRDLWAFFSGPAFLPWQRMGNLQAWGGPLDDAWINAQHDLQLQILAAMRAYGMTPVLPGFAGHVPSALQRIYPNANFTTNAGWGNFNATYSADTLLEPTDPLFVQIGTTFHQMVLAEYGEPSEAPFFNADMYNEMDPSSTDLTFLKDCNAATYQAMANADPRSTYVMQAWLFHSGFWSADRVQAYLSGVPVGGMLILDLNTEEGPVWNMYDSFYGHEWVWNALLVYGGRRGIYGDLQRLATGPYEDRNASATLVGMGITPEAIDMVLPAFDLMFESGWRNASVNASEWFQTFAVRRYGRYSNNIASAYAILETAAFSHDIDTSSVEKVAEVREGDEPGFSRNTNATGILQALRAFYAAATAGEVDTTTGPFSYDLTDLSRQVLCNLFSDYHELLGAQWTRAQADGVNNTAEVLSLSSALLSMIDMIDAVDSADINFLLGGWLADAAAWGFNSSQSANRDFNARNQVTLWGPDGEIIDYAAKVGWAGLVGDFYRERWGIFTQYLINATVSGVAPNWGQYYADVLAYSQAWGVNMSRKYPVVPSGANPVALAGAVLNAYASGNASNYRILRNSQVASSAPGSWVHLGDNVAAVGTDCPYEAHGPSSSLGACESACGADAACNVINWNPDIPDCVFRVCTNPLNPVLSPGYTNYSVYGDGAAKGAVVMAAWHTDTAVLMALCDADPGCAGFDTTGLVALNVSTLAGAPGVDTYVKVAGTAPRQPYAPGAHAGLSLPQRSAAPRAASAKARGARARR